MSGVRTQFVRKMATKVLADNKITVPPVDLLVILQANGIEYRVVDDFPGSVDALIIEEGSKIYAAVNSRQHLHRQRFSLAHELGHYFLHREGGASEEVTIDDAPLQETDGTVKDPAETEADLFAGELLVPLRMLKLHARRSIPELSRIFVVSEQVVAVAISKHMKALFK